MGPCILSIFQYISSKMQRYTVYLETALHVSDGTTTHHQEANNCIYCYICICAIVEELELFHDSGRTK